MRNRNLLFKKLENLETTLITLNSIVNRQAPIETYRSNIVKAQSLVEEIQDMVEREPMESNEINRTRI
tara:strand:+ start:1367 stop:1570 length:204 start_codon:yes stop_codon:yes gene_type:complete